ncbi:MAG: class I SAM-dependent methyltransferase [Bacteriovoracaceae bacterium]
MTDQTKKTYDQIAEDYHQKRLDKSLSGWNEYLEVPAMEALIKPLVKNKKVLDLGCGSGILTSRLISWGAKAEGLELSPQMVEIGKKVYPEITFTVGNAESIPFEDKIFDVVGSSLVMHYMKDLEKPFKEVSRILKPGGHFVFSIHHPMNEVLKMNDKDVFAHPYFHNNLYHWEMCGAKLESYHHTFEHIITKLQACGFVVESLIECKPDPQIKNEFSDFDFTSNYPTFCVFRTCLRALT